MRQEVHAIIRVTLEAPVELSQGKLLAFVRKAIGVGPKIELLGVLEEAEIYHPEGID